MYYSIYFSFVSFSPAISPNITRDVNLLPVTWLPVTRTKSLDVKLWMHKTKIKKWKLRLVYIYMCLSVNPCQDHALTTKLSDQVFSMTSHEMSNSVMCFVILTSVVVRSHQKLSKYTACHFVANQNQARYSVLYSVCHEVKKCISTYNHKADKINFHLTGRICLWHL